MKNIYFPEEDITENDLFFVCSMIERVARHIKQRNKYVVNKIGYELCTNIPTPLDMGKVYMRLILQTRLDAEDYAQGIIRVYNDDICETIDNYNSSAYYEPSYFIARSYFAGGFM